MSAGFKTYFVTLPALDAGVAEKLEGHKYHYKIESINVEIGNEIEKPGKSVGKFGVYVENSKQSYWTKELITGKEGIVKKINVLEGSKVIQGYVFYYPWANNILMLKKNFEIKTVNH